MTSKWTTGVIWTWAICGVLALPRTARATDAPVTDDAFVSAGAANANNGGNANLRVEGVKQARRSFLRFDLGTLPAGTIPGDVAKATLLLFANTVNAPGVVDVAPVGGTWAEATITTATAPPVGARATGFEVLAGRDNTFIAVDLTSVVRSWVGGAANNGVALVPAATPGVQVAFDAKEGAHPPRLEVTVAPSALAGRVATLEAQVSTLQSEGAALRFRVEDLEEKLGSVSVTGTDFTFSGVNVHIVNGDPGGTGTVNGVGNLIVGYNEPRSTGVNERTGSHNIVLGDANNFSSFGGLVAGRANEISGSLSCVIGGSNNIASGFESIVTGGTGNRAEGLRSSVTGGAQNVASGVASAVAGGAQNTASGRISAVSGGELNEAAGLASTVGGGFQNTVVADFGALGGDAVGLAAEVARATAAEGGLQNEISPLAQKLASVSVSGTDFTLSGVNVRIVNGSGQTTTANGLGNLIVGYNEARTVGNNVRTGSHNIVVGDQQNFSSAGGLVAGFSNEIAADFASVTGGRHNIASGLDSSVCGGFGNHAEGVHSVVSGGANNVASGASSAIAGGVDNTASGGGSAVSGGHLNVVAVTYGLVGDPAGLADEIARATGAEAALEGEIAPLETKLASVSVSGKELTFSGVNVHIVNGSGATGDVDGSGNLIVGYNEPRGLFGIGGDVRTGSHNIVVGTRLNYTSWGGIVVGDQNAIEGAGAFCAGFLNFATGESSAVSGGFANTASGLRSWVGGGAGNTASADGAAVSGDTSAGAAIGAETARAMAAEGGLQNQISPLAQKLASVTASPTDFTFSGVNVRIVNGDPAGTESANGLGNLIVGYNELRSTGNARTGSHNVVIGKENNFTSWGGLVVGLTSAIDGHFSLSAGFKNVASGLYSVVVGGVQNEASAVGSAVLGGFDNVASGTDSVAAGGTGNTASGSASSVAGGQDNVAAGFRSFVGGGAGNSANGQHASVIGGTGQTAAGFGDYASGDTPAIAAEVARATAAETALGARVTPLEAKLAHVSATPTEVVFDHVNVRIVNGEGTTDATNKLGNLIIGYNELRAEGGDLRSGSHNLILGKGNNFTSYGGLVVGTSNWLYGPLAFCAGGHNIAMGECSSVAGGSDNQASGEFSSVGGGASNQAEGRDSSVGGGLQNLAFGPASSVSGGKLGTASGAISSVTGGIFNVASGDFSSVSGGADNEASGDDASVSGGLENLASDGAASVSGGYSNIASAPTASVSGGSFNKAKAEQSSVSGGVYNVATGLDSSVSGGIQNTASGDFSSASGGVLNSVDAIYGWVTAGFHYPP